MFVGSVPGPLLAQAVKAIDFAAWPAAYVLCSGSFKIERALRSFFPALEIHSNDVSLLSCAIGELALGRDLPIRFVKELAWIEDGLSADATLRDRLAAILIADEYAPHATGADSIYKTKHREHMVRAFPARLIAARAAVDRVMSGIAIQGFFAGDLREHARAAIAAGAGVIGFPRTYSGGYERLFRFMHANIEWPAPSYSLFDPSTIAEIMAELDAAGVPWFIMSDRDIADRTPLTELRPGRQHPIFRYGSAGGASFRQIADSNPTPFAYRQLEVDKLTAETQVTITLVDSGKASFVKDVYLAKNIQHSAAEMNFAVFLDGMLAGLIGYSLSRLKAYSKREIYMLSDLATSRDRRLSKLIVRLSAGRTILRELDKHYVRAHDLVVTTAFSKHPVSMKYRGIYELLKRKDEPDGGFLLNYACKPIDETAQDAYAWWWSANGKI